jgi:hypothetical protein
VVFSNDSIRLADRGLRMTLHDWGTEFSADPERMRTLAFGVLSTAA